MDYDTILNNIRNFLNNASSEDMAEINEVISSRTEDDVTLEEYLEGIYNISIQDPSLYTSENIQLKVYDLQYDSSNFASAESHYTATQKMDSTGSDHLQKKIKKAA